MHGPAFQLTGFFPSCISLCCLLDAEDIGWISKRLHNFAFRGKVSKSVPTVSGELTFYLVIGIVAQKRKEKNVGKTKTLLFFSLNITPTPNYSHGSFSRQNFKVLTTSEGSCCAFLLVGYLCEREETGNE